MTIRFIREKMTRFPIWTGWVGDMPRVTIDQPSGVKNGWCVYRFGSDVGDHDASGAQWFGRFEQAKRYAYELARCKC
jgi:hypothetical protein